MGRPPRRPPSYRLHKPTGLAVVRLDGRDRYLGKHGTEASYEAYRRLIAEWAMAAPPCMGADQGGAAGDGRAPTVDELLVDYWDRHAAAYYVKNGRPTSEQDNIRQALRFLRRLYGSLPAADFGPLALKAVRQRMIEAGRCRTLINKDINRIRAMFRWAVEQEILPASVLQALLAVPGLRRGRSGAREAPPVRPVPPADVEATLLQLSPQVAAMVRLQLLTGARPGEIIAMRPADVTPDTDKVWVYRPPEHKNEHHGRTREIMLGPRAQEVLRPWLARPPHAYCFSPAEVVTARAGAPRRPPTGPTRRTSRPDPGRRYTKDSYRIAVRRACRRAGVPAWSPLQLRHTRATELRGLYGLEAARVVLGHARADTTQIYAERDAGRARQIAAEVG